MFFNYRSIPTSNALNQTSAEYRLCTNHGIFNTRNVACILTAYSEGFVSSNDPPYNKTASVTLECSLPLSRRHGVVRVALGREGGREGTQL